MISSNDLPLFRLAEVYLNYAEAKAELGTLTQTDIDNTINKLRTRAGVTGKLNMNAANLSPDPYMCAPETGYVNVTGDNKGVILEIRRERAIELVMEGFRYYDLMRWKEGQCMAQSLKDFIFLLQLSIKRMILMETEQMMSVSTPHLRNPMWGV